MQTFYPCALCREVEDLAYLAAFPGGKPPRPAPNSPGRHLDDLAPDNDDSVSESSSEELFPSDEEVTDDPDGEHVNVKKTHRLQVGVLEGTTFLNNYIVVDTLGRGAFGKVKLCLNVADDSLYAVKVVEKQLVSAAVTATVDIG